MLGLNNQTSNLIESRLPQDKWKGQGAENKAKQERKSLKSETVVGKKKEITHIVLT